MKKGINKYGIKLEDYSDFASYQRACIACYDRTYQKTEKGKLASKKYRTKYIKTEKGKISNLRYQLSEKCKLTRKKYKQVNRTSILADTNKRRASKLKRTPVWADLKAIKQFYINCPKGYHVDHIVPLQGVNVSGFHVLNNLQYLTASENFSKSNKYAT